MDLHTPGLILQLKIVLLVTSLVIIYSSRPNSKSLKLLVLLQKSFKFPFFQTLGMSLNQSRNHSWSLESWRIRIGWKRCGSLMYQKCNICFPMFSIQYIHDVNTTHLWQVESWCTEMHSWLMLMGRNQCDVMRLLVLYIFMSGHTILSVWVAVSWAKSWSLVS